ncbi:MAG: hypothetical protein HYU66_00620 [Armatimonadetes bacterium]|nr:hypothetical protein [Armatimonadota bacterium]
MAQKRVEGPMIPDGLTVEDMIRELQRRHPGRRILGDQVRYALRRSGVQRGHKAVVQPRPRVEVVAVVALGDAEKVIAEYDRRYVAPGDPPGEG